MTGYDVGINYWPASAAMRWWDRFDADAYERDVTKVADAGCRSIRVFLLWESFQPDSDRVDRAALANLERVADITATHGIRLVPTLFTGHMSGANWLPRWASTRGERGPRPVVSGGEYRDVTARNWFEDPQIIEAQALLAREAASALRGHEALLAWDLGNENSNVCVPPSRDAGRAWLARITDELRRADPSCRITIGLHLEDLEEDRRIGPREAAEVCDFLCMHGYPLYAPWARSRTDAALPAFLADVTRWLGRKDVYFEEFGMPAPTGDEEMQDAYVGEALELLYVRGTLGAMLWCFADYAEEMWDQPPLDVAPHERFFGLWRADGTPKPAVRHFARYAGVAPKQTLPYEFDGDPHAFYDAPAETLQRLYADYTIG